MSDQEELSLNPVYVYRLDHYEWKISGLLNELDKK